MSFSDQLRREIEASELSRYKIAQLTGVPAPTLCRFVGGTSGLSVKSIDALCKLLELKLVGPNHSKSRK
jgi:hypothetical protein